jgi:diguanylate cyclase (GGDEF)-like protein/PAS domain S-box-containing protein
LPGELLQGVHTAADSVVRMRHALSRESGFHGELLNYRKDGTPYWVELSITPLHDASGTLTGFVGLSRDVTARRAQERERQTLAAALAVAADGVAIIDAAGTLEFVNHAFARQRGEPADRLLGKAWVSLYAPAEAEFLTRMIRGDVTSLGFWNGEVHGARGSGETFPQELSLTLLPQGGMVAVIRDISERKAAEDRLKFLSTRDELTGLLNRRGFLQAAEKVLTDVRRRGRSCALLYGDLDAFKLINDHFGHPTGDRALQELAELLQQTFRASDLIARLGGDEFTVLAVDVGREEIERVIHRLEAAVHARNAARARHPSEAWTLGISLGVAFGGAGADVESLLKDADAAQYQQKMIRRAKRAA